MRVERVGLLWKMVGTRRTRDATAEEVLLALDLAQTEALLEQAQRDNHFAEMCAAQRECRRLAGERDLWRDLAAEAQVQLCAARRERDEVRAEVERLTGELADERVVCLCGCPDAEHESRLDDGESCGHDDHDCIRVCPAALDVAQRLRTTLESETLRAQGLLKQATTEQDRALQAEQENARLREALRKHGQHSPRCTYTDADEYGPETPCNCGLRAALAAQPEREVRCAITVARDCCMGDCSREHRRECGAPMPCEQHAAYAPAVRPEPADRPEAALVARLAGEMRAKLAARRHKGGWRGESTTWLAQRLRDEADELEAAVIDRKPVADVWAEAADVAAFAAMVADVYEQEGNR